MLSDEVAELFAEAQLLAEDFSALSHSLILHSPKGVQKKAVKRIYEPQAIEPKGKPIPYQLTRKAHEELQRRRRAREAFNRRQANTLLVRLA